MRLALRTLATLNGVAAFLAGFCALAIGPNGKLVSAVSYNHHQQVRKAADPTEKVLTPEQDEALRLVCREQVERSSENHRFVFWAAAVFGLVNAVALEVMAGRLERKSS
jgi:predicted outer membrane lipoprotein